jgi:hypothetical protein
MTVRVLVVLLAQAVVASTARATPNPPPLPPEAAEQPTAGRSLDLGSYELAALQSALQARGLELDPHPEGKVVRRIHVVNLDVFGQGTGFLQWFNMFHRTTRERAIEREVLLRPGDLWDEAVLQDSRRRLTDPLFSALVVMVAVVAPDPAQVDLLVVTQDIWSLRMNSDFLLDNDTLTALSLSISENNLLGWRKQAAVVFNMGLGSYSIGPLYLDKNVAGTRLQFLSHVEAIFSRETSEREGSRGTTRLIYPLWSLTRTWSGGIAVFHFDSVERRFRGTEVDVYDARETPELEQIPYRWNRRLVEAEAVGSRSFGTAIRSTVTGGYELRVDRSSLPDDVVGSPAALDSFARTVLPRSERSSALVARYSLFTPRFVRYRNVDTYDLPEDRQAGPELKGEVKWATRAFGSENNFVRLEAELGWVFDVAESGFVRLGARATSRVQGGLFNDNTVSASFKAVTVPLWLQMRLVVGGLAIVRFRETGNDFLLLGGQTGLRGYPIGNFRTVDGSARQTLVRGNVEVRSPAAQVLFSRVGTVAFWDAGHVAETLRDIELHHDVGIGLRVLLPQLQPSVFRFDWALPLNGLGAGLPGRFSAGVQQVF